MSTSCGLCRGQVQRIPDFMLKGILRVFHMSLKALQRTGTENTRFHVKGNIKSISCPLQRTGTENTIQHLIQQLRNINDINTTKKETLLLIPNAKVE